MQIKYPYDGGKDKAYEKIDSLLSELETKYADQISELYKEWNDSKDFMNFKFKVRGFSVVGDIKIEEKKVILNGKLPLAGKIFKGKIKSTIEDTLKELFV